MNLTNFVQCPDIDCNGMLFAKLDENTPDLTERILKINCMGCGKKWEIIIEPDAAEEL